MKKNLDDIKKVEVWNVSLVSGRSVRVATVDQGPRKPSMCTGCPSPCCKGMFDPILTGEEFTSRKFHMKYIDPPSWVIDNADRPDLPAIDYLATVDTDPVLGCIYFDHETSTCSVYPDCPKSCLSYDCRDDDRPEIREFALERAKTWQA